MKYGHFDDKKREYVIETPYTPTPWINYLGNNGFYGLISNTGGGYDFYQDAKLRRLTRYRYNNIPNDLGGRLYYINDNGLIWSPTFLPASTMLDSYKCRHGLGYTVFESEKNGISTELLCFVPQDDNCEINRLKLVNNSGETKHLIVYGALEWCLWNAVDDGTNFQRNLNIGEVEVDDNTIYHKTEYRERRNHFAFHYGNRSHNGFDSDREHFLGRFNSFVNPRAVTEKTSYQSIAAGNAPISAHRYEITLAPNEVSSLIFILGYVENKQEEKFISLDVINKSKAYGIINRYNTDFLVDEAFKAVKIYWQDLLQKFQIKSTDAKLDRMVNIWNQYQCMVTFNMSRSASYYESGTGRGMGFRDSCQDILGFVHLIPERSRERILDIASIQSKNGSTYHQYQPLTKRGNADVGSGFNDDPLWLVAGTASYIKETGDFSILHELVPFDNVQGSEVPLFDHLRASMHYIANHLGPHNLPLIGRADWNDCLNLNCFSTTPGESFQTTENVDYGKAESVFIAAMFVYYGKDYITMAESIGQKEEAADVEQTLKKIEEAVIHYGWDGNWYLRAYDSFSNKIGSQETNEGKIFVEAQAFCSLANIGDNLGYPRKALKNGLKYLLNDFGLELLYPAYTTYHLELGEISSYPPGNKENGSIFCHTNPWYVIALIQHQEVDAAFDLYKRFTPAYIEDKSDIHETEPYVYSQTIAGRSSKSFGRAKNSWLTGTASWAFVAVSQAIIGIVPTFDGLRIHPALPTSIDEVSVHRHFRNCDYDIVIKHRGLKQPELFIDGHRVDGDILPLDEQLKHQIDYIY
ncbi:MAG TPA: glycosyl transferase [Bacilli bacterium]|nr:glycosyl transferase [Bacilli bacterium]